jgi:CRP-like cAMP-binding protein
MDTPIEVLTVPAGTCLTIEGEPSRDFYVLLEGVATVACGGRTIRTLVGADIVGEIGLLTRAPRTATVETVVPSRVAILDEGSFRRLVDTDSDFAALTWASAEARLP